jgi:hypothetical protein
MAREYHGRQRETRYRLAPQDQALLDRLAAGGRSPEAASRSLGVTVAQVDKLLNGGQATERAIDTMSAALAAYRAAHERGAA